MLIILLKNRKILKILKIILQWIIIRIKKYSVRRCLDKLAKIIKWKFKFTIDKFENIVR
jgi:hypothetical protein